MIPLEAIQPIAWPDIPGLDVWRIHLSLPDEVIDRLKSHLSTMELEKASRFRFDRDRRRYAVAHAGMRLILAAYWGCRPADVTIVPDPLGKPMLAGTNARGGLNFNLSHAGEEALLGIGRQLHIGVDIEQVRPVADLKELAGAVLSARELASFTTLNPEERSERFFRIWTCKEAAVKANGAGLAIALPDVLIEPVTLVEYARFEAVGAMPGSQRLYGMGFCPVAGYHAAVVTEAADFQVTLRDWPGDWE